MMLVRLRRSRTVSRYGARALWGLTSRTAEWLMRKPKVPRKDREAATLGRFVQQYERKAQKGVEPNDRRYDRKVEKAVKRMKPEKLDALLRDDD